VNILVSASGSLPDLTAGSVSYDQNTKTLSADVSNIGNAPTDNPVYGTYQSSSFYNTFEISPESSGASAQSLGTHSALSTLSPGASATASNIVPTSYTTTWFFTPGTHYARVCADKNYDFNGTVTESNENNNCGPWTPIVIPSMIPVVSISANPSTGVVNVVNPTIYWSVTNNPTSCTATGDWVATGAKSATGSESQGVLTVKKVYRYFLACSNSYGSSESAAAIVTVSDSAQGPDLVASAITPTTAELNANVMFVSNISNIGNMSTNYLSSPPKGSGGKTIGAYGFSNQLQIASAPNGSGTITSLDPVGTSEILAPNGSFPFKQNYKFTSPGLYSLRACANVDFDLNLFPQGWGVDETDKGNNCGPWTNVIISGGSLPDLSASAVTPNTAIINTPVTLSSTITNSGTATTGISFQNFLQVRDIDGATTHDLASTSMNALAAGANNTATKSYTFTSAGTYSVRACADKTNHNDTGVIAELDETNNCSAWIDILVSSSPRPDLTASAPDQTTATLGVSVSFSSTITNAGMASTGSAFSNFFQVATAANGGGTLTDLPPTSMNALNPGLFRVASQSYIFNSIGMYSVRACADKSNRNDTGVITESNELNNCSGWTTVTVSGANTCVPNQGNDCISAPNGCGQISSGSIQCNGSCSASTPPTPSPCPVCANGATNPPECTFDGGSCLNGATNPPECTLDAGGKCINGSANPPVCKLKKPIFKED
jgi:hypothetical protein